MHKLDEATSNPIDIALRWQMKGQFLDCFTREVNPIPEWPKAELVIYGSTTMRQIALEKDIKLPFSGIKSSDIDIGVKEADGTSDADDFKYKYKKFVSPLIKKTAIDCGFDYMSETGKEVCACALRNLPADHFAGEFFLRQTFSPQQMHDQLRTRSDYEEIKSFIPSEPKQVLLRIGANELPFPHILQPVNFHIDSRGHLEGRKITLKRSNRIDMLAGKLARCMEGFKKPTDLIDIYNLVKGYHPSDNAPIVDVNPQSPKNDLETLRVLIDARLIFMRMHEPYNRTNLFDTFKDTPENRALFIEKCKDQIAENRMPELKAMAGDIFQTCDKLIHDVYAPRSKVRIGAGNFTQNEVDFFDHAWGRKPLNIEKTGQAPSVTLFGKVFHKKQPVKPMEKELAEPFINIQALKKEFPKAFEKRPHMDRDITCNPLINNFVDEIIVGRGRR
jgi:hypothetical protein